MKNGGMHVLDALVTSEKLGKVMTIPPQYDVEKVLAVPRGELADRGGGDIDILVGRDNTHFFPKDLDSPQGIDRGMRLFRAVLDRGVMYAGSVRGSPGKITSPESRKISKICKNSLFSLSLLMMVGLNTLAPADGFIAYDCMNASNTVEAYSLLAPEECHVTGGEHKVERIVQAEVVQVKRERSITVFRCQVLETLVSQYCGHSSAAGVTRYLRFREPLLVEPKSCREALNDAGNITIANRNFRARIGTTTSHSFFVAGDLDDGHNCETGSISIGSKVLEYQATQTILEITLMEEFAKINDVHGSIRLPGGIQAKVADQAISDSLVGTIVWRHRPTSCPGGLTQLYRGNLKIYANNTSSFLGSVAILEEKGQVAGLELQSSLLLCHHPAFRTHLRDVLVVIHPDNVSSIVGDPFDASQVSDFIRIESELSFLHVKTTLSQRDKIRQVKLAICETRRQVASTRLESIAGTENPYSLMEVFGRGHLATKSGATVYITKCWPVSVTPRAVQNCTMEIPAVFNGTDVFIDPISYIIKSHAVPVRCTDIAPPRFLIGGRWYCLFEGRGLSECHSPLNIPIATVEIEQEDSPKWGLGRSIYSPEQLKAFHEFQMSNAVRAAYVADASELAFNRRSADGQWGLALGQHAQEAIIDMIGLSFIPLYRIIGPASMIVIFILFFVGVTRLVLTVLFRAIVLGRTKGCGYWIMAAFFGCVYQIVISPLQWADNTARRIAEKVERGMIEGAEDGYEAKESNYPDLEAARRREETHDFWREMMEKGFNKCRWGGRNSEDQAAAPPRREVEEAPEQEGLELNPLRNQNPE
jgi:hypothetical protein